MKYEQKGYGKPYMKSLDEIEEQTQELKHNSYNHETDQGFKDKDQLSDYLISIDDSIVDVKTLRGEYKEVMKKVEYPETKYLFSPLALKEISKLVGEKAYDSKTLESLTKQALNEEIVYLKKGGFKEKVVLDYIGSAAEDFDADEFGDGEEVDSRTDPANLDDDIKNRLTEIESITYVLTSNEDLEKLGDTSDFLELYTLSPLPGDTLCVGDLDLATQKKINNFEYGGTTHDFFEPINHEWENEHSND